MSLSLSLNDAGPVVSATGTERFSLDAKYAGLQKNIWKEFTDLDSELNPVNLSSGSPDFIPVKSIITEWNTVCGLSDKAEMHQYTNQSGHPRLVRALASLYGKLLNRTIDPRTEILITLGASNALFCAIMSNVGFGEEVIIIEPSFDCYESLVRLAGGTAVFIPLRQKDPSNNTSSAWGLDSNELRSLFNSKTKAIILNTPNNPLGKVFSSEELLEISNLCKEFNVLIISDEVYEWFVFEGKHVRMSSIDWDRTVTLGSVGKTFGLTGWRLGWAYGPAALIRNLQVASSNCVYAIETPAQEVIAATLELELKALDTPDSIFYKMRQDLRERRDIMVKIAKNGGLEPIIPEAGIFLLANWKPLASIADFKDEKDEYRDFRFVKWLAKHRNLLGIPPSIFYSKPHKALGEDFIRLCYYRKAETLQNANSILMDLKLEDKHD